jgi:hypothetical protein
MYRQSADFAGTTGDEPNFPQPSATQVCDASYIAEIFARLSSGDLSKQAFG